MAQGGKAAATAAVAVEGVSPLTAGGKRKLGELGKLGEALAPREGRAAEGRAGG